MSSDGVTLLHVLQISFKKTHLFLFPSNCGKSSWLNFIVIETKSHHVVQVGLELVVYPRLVSVSVFPALALQMCPKPDSIHKNMKHSPKEAGRKKFQGWVKERSWSVGSFIPIGKKWMRERLEGPKRDNWWCFHGLWSPGSDISPLWSPWHLRSDEWVSSYQIASLSVGFLGTLWNFPSPRWAGIQLRIWLNKPRWHFSHLRVDGLSSLSPHSFLSPHGAFRNAFVKEWKYSSLLSSWGSADTLARQGVTSLPPVVGEQSG